MKETLQKGKYKGAMRLTGGMCVAIAIVLQIVPLYFKVLVEGINMIGLYRFGALNVLAARTTGSPFTLHR